MKSRFFALGVALTLGFVGAGHASDRNEADRAAIIALTEDVFAAVAARDGARLRQLLLPNAVFFVLDSSKPAEPLVTNTVEGFIAAIQKNPGSSLERMGDAQVQVHGALATLWAPYDVRRDGKLSHCGYDALQFVRLEGRWRLAVVTYTKYPADRCPPHN